MRDLIFECADAWWSGKKNTWEKKNKALCKLENSSLMGTKSVKEKAASNDYFN